MDMGVPGPGAYEGGFRHRIAHAPKHQACRQARCSSPCTLSGRVDAHGHLASSWKPEGGSQAHPSHSLLTHTTNRKNCPTLKVLLLLLLAVAKRRETNCGNNATA
eukprot:scaffold155346_cov32-Tisochrysis_lutea.AAC.1